jgi:hypothetical protein
MIIPLRLQFGEITVEFWFDEDHPIEEFLDDCVLVLGVRVGDRIEFCGGVFIYACLYTLCRSCVLIRASTGL